ncbi:rCG37791 [Rattus norvegicus]|uniref:RCG37791 n=1 Tax=Rattus norvegicus TaxID=10116 RepID=A6JF81_RAT|nr:rCG37791 [Rattus norvegicus]
MLLCRKKKNLIFVGHCFPMPFKGIMAFKGLILLKSVVAFCFIRSLLITYVSSLTMSKKKKSPQGT